MQGSEYGVLAVAQRKENVTTEIILLSSELNSTLIINEYTKI